MFADKEKKCRNFAGIRKIELNERSERSETNIGEISVSLVISPLPSPPTCSGRSDSETIMNGAGRFPSDIDFAELIPTVVRRVRDNRSAGSHNADRRMYSAALDTLSIHSGIATAERKREKERAAIGHAPCFATPLQPATALFISPCFYYEPYTRSPQPDSPRLPFMRKILPDRKSNDRLKSKALIA